MTKEFLSVVSKDVARIFTPVSNPSVLELVVLVLVVLGF